MLYESKQLFFLLKIITDGNGELIKKISSHENGGTIINIFIPDKINN